MVAECRHWIDGRLGMYFLFIVHLRLVGQEELPTESPRRAHCKDAYYTYSCCWVIWQRSTKPKERMWHALWDGRKQLQECLHELSRGIHGQFAQITANRDWLYKCQADCDPAAKGYTTWHDRIRGDIQIVYTNWRPSCTASDLCEHIQPGFTPEKWEGVQVRSSWSVG